MEGALIAFVVGMIFYCGTPDLHTRICKYLEAKTDEARANARRARWPDHRGG